MPYALVADTVTAYVVPGVSPAMTHVRPGLERIVPVVEQLKPPGLVVAM